MLIDPTDDLRAWIASANPVEAEYLNGLPRSLLIELYRNVKIVGDKADNVIELANRVNEKKQPGWSKKFDHWATQRGSGLEMSEDWGTNLVNLVTDQVMSRDEFQIGHKMYGYTFVRAFSRAARSYLIEEWLDLEAPHKWEPRQEAARAFRMLANSYGMKIVRPRVLPNVKYHISVEDYEKAVRMAESRQP